MYMIEHKNSFLIHVRRERSGIFSTGFHYCVGEVVNTGSGSKKHEGKIPLTALEKKFRHSPWRLID